MYVSQVLGGLLSLGIGNLGSGKEVGCGNWSVVEFGEANATCCWYYWDQEGGDCHHAVVLWSTCLEDSHWTDSSSLKASISTQTSDFLIPVFLHWRGFKQRASTVEIFFERWEWRTFTCWTPIDRIYVLVSMKPVAEWLGLMATLN